MPCSALEGGYARTSSPSKPASRNLVALNPHTTLRLFMLSQKKMKVLVIQSNSAIPWTVGRQAPLSMEFSKQEYCSGLPFPFPGDLPFLGIKLESFTLQADSLPSEPPGNRGSPYQTCLDAQPTNAPLLALLQIHIWCPNRGQIWCDSKPAYPWSLSPK